MIQNHLVSSIRCKNNNQKGRILKPRELMEIDFFASLPRCCNPYMKPNPYMMPNISNLQPYPPTQTTYQPWRRDPHPNTPAPILQESEDYCLVDYDNVDFKDYECKFRLEKQKQKEEREPEPTYTNHFATLCETFDPLNPMKLLEHERIEMCDYARMLIKHYNEEKGTAFEFVRLVEVLSQIVEPQAWPLFCYSLKPEVPAPMLKGGFMASKPPCFTSPESNLKHPRI
uniref:Uncharacterized protein n=1 Tax=Fagus sylvatica TaxID=28930 RepID=A0A2N9ETN8_FAGSY